MFYVVHTSFIDIMLETALYATCAVVQLIKLCNFLGEKKRQYFSALACVGALIALLLFAINITHIVVLIWYPTKTLLGVI